MPFSHNERKNTSKCDAILQNKNRKYCAEFDGPHTGNKGLRSKCRIKQINQIFKTTLF